MFAKTSKIINKTKVLRVRFEPAIPHVEKLFFSRTTGDKTMKGFQEQQAKCYHLQYYREPVETLLLLKNVFYLSMIDELIKLNSIDKRVKIEMKILYCISYFTRRVLDLHRCC